MTASVIQIIISLCIGLGLSAACGFRVFVPLLVTSLAANSGYLPLAENMQWLGSWTAIICLGTATLLEVVAYYFPWFDHILDVVAAPAALIAGVILTASVLAGVDPAWQWGLGVIVGGGSAGITQTGTTTLRLGSSATTGGFGNPVIATFEHIAALVGSLFSIWLPVFAAIFTLGLFGVLFYLFTKKKKSSSPNP
jgi:hypothetical protein